MQVLRGPDRRLAGRGIHVQVGRVERHGGLPLGRRRRRVHAQIIVMRKYCDTVLCCMSQSRTGRQYCATLKLPLSPLLAPAVAGRCAAARVRDLAA